MAVTLHRRRRRAVVDLRKPSGRCRTWLRAALLRMERRGIIDATEERFPAHFHVVVYGPPPEPTETSVGGR